MSFWISSLQETLIKIQNTVGVGKSNKKSGKIIDSDKRDNKRYERVGYSILHKNRGDYQIHLGSDLSSSEEELHVPTSISNKSKSKFSSIMVKNNYGLKHSDIENSMQELIYSKKKIRKLRIILGITFAVLALALITVAVVLLVNSKDDDDDNNDDNNGRDDGLQLNDIVSGEFVAKRWNGSWATDGTVIYKHEGKIFEFDPATQKRKVLADPSDKLSRAVVYEKSADGKYLLVGRDYFKIYRHSFEALYEVIDLATGEYKPININGKPERLLLAKWAPVGNGLVLNFARNLFYKPTALSDEIQLTSDNDPAILNGIPDWVYEEEVFSINSAVWFNPSGTKLAYARFDDRPTRVINFPYYGEAGDLRYQYPYDKPVAYPKAGSPNPLVKLYQVNLIRALKSEEIPAEISVPAALNTEDHIITIVQWLNDEYVFSVWMNRIQNRAHLQVSNELKRYEIYTIESSTGWVDLFAEPFKNKDGSQLALILPHDQGNGAGDYRHLSLLSTKESNKLRNSPIPLTSGKYVVQSILFWSEESNLIFYSANTPEKSHISNVYAIEATTGRTPQCLTCGIKSFDVEQTYFTADFSQSRNFVVIATLGPGVPTSVIYEWSYQNKKISLKKIIEFEANEKLAEKLAKKSLPTFEYLTMPIADGLTAKVLLQLPPNMDRSGKKKYPMLVDVYGGPDSNSVTDKWGIDWGTYLSTNRSVIYAKIDGRGSGLRGDKLLHSLYLKLGTVEITDQIQVTKSLQDKFPFIDAAHTGIWGWSYGGYASAMALAKDNSTVFKCAASVAPVTDWAYYDSIYTERYMGLPEANINGYKKSRLSTLAKQFEGKKYLLIHGTLDDNVHYQQAMVLVKNLERNNILFKQISYPDEDHALAGVRPHLYHSLDRFFGECFGIQRKRFY